MVDVAGARAQVAKTTTPYQIFLKGHPDLPPRPARDEGQFPIGEWQKAASKVYNKLSTAELQRLRREADDVNKAQRELALAAAQNVFGPVSEEQRAQSVILYETWPVIADQFLL